MRRRVGAIAVAAGLLALVGAGGQATPVASAELHHAAVVIDAGDGKVRKFCLAFPEESISGAEALRRIESDAVFASYGSKGQAVCSLCGVGCPSGNCFCDGSKYWAYHRAAPGGAPYKHSTAGVSSTSVRDGDVEGWRWGSGAAPPPATVSEVCDVPEPPARAASSSGASPPTSSATTTSAAPPPAAGRADAVPSTTTPTGSAGAPTAPPTSRPAPPAPAGAPPVADRAAVSAGGPTPDGEADVSTEGAPGEVEEPAPSDADPTDESAADETGSRRRLPSAADGSIRPAEEGRGGLIGLVAFVALLGSVLAWRARLRRANVRS